MVSSVQPAATKSIPSISEMPLERVDLLSVLLEAQDEDGEHMSDRQVLDECTVLLKWIARSASAASPG